MITTEHSLVSQLRVLARTIEQWEELVEANISKATPDRLENWQIGIEYDLQSAIKKIGDHFKSLER